MLKVSYGVRLASRTTGWLAWRVASTINRWKREHEDFADALVRGKDEFDTRHAEAALLKAALGYSFTEVIKERTEDGMAVTREVTKHAAPNPTCLIFWL